jgi:hypothetical protein
MKRSLLIIGMIWLFIAEILHVFFIMPFPGSQLSNTIDIAYFINKHIWAIRIIGIVLVLFPLIELFGRWKTWGKILFIFFGLLYCGIFYMVNFKFLADKMFYQPKTKLLVPASENKIPLEKLVLGIEINGQSKAYPIELIGYHHQVQDTLGGQPIMVTYCTVCRTGRIYSPIVNGKKESFRLVGMDHFNAMFEDRTTKSWWRQATGEVVAGKMKGFSLQELPSEQMRLSGWLRKHPGSLIMQPDPAFAGQYKSLIGFDAGSINSGLERRDSSSWHFKSWVVGVAAGKYSKAYDWNELAQKKVINDSLPGIPLAIVIEPDNASFHVWNRMIRGQSLIFQPDSSGLKDQKGDTWNYDGICTSGTFRGESLQNIQASQEFWHSWQTFHPNTQSYK